MHDLDKGHWWGVKWILRYLLKTVDVSLIFEQEDACNQLLSTMLIQNMLVNWISDDQQLVMCLLLKENQ